jgi:uncharacterized protein YydD (DUF2326 family)
MFLKSLIISKNQTAIRQVLFRRGINLIVDETPEDDKKATGNNVGKTTVLKLIDFCLGAESKSIYIDPETRKDYILVRDFLTKEEVLITLTLKEDLEIDNSKEVIIERNFLSRKKKIQKINNEELTDDEFEIKLLQLIFPEHHSEKPSLRQIISHNIRHKDESISNTLKTLNQFTNDAEYETLFLFLFGCEFENGNSKQMILEKISQENTFKNRLEKYQTKTAYETALALVNSEIETLNKTKDSLNSNKNFEADLDALNKIKYQINRISSEISQLAIRKDIIIEAEQELSARKSEIDLQQLHSIYQQASGKIEGIHKTFVELVEYHNQMIFEKVKFIKKELPNLENNIKEKQVSLQKELEKEIHLSSLITKSDSFEEMQGVIFELNERFRKKGEYESTIKQIGEVEKNIRLYNEKLKEIDDELFSDGFENNLLQQLNKFNKYFSSVSEILYGEQYAVKYDIETNKKGQRLYKFSAFNTNFSSGKKQGEISCFDIAYILFADQENIPCLHFILNDKKELMHDNQLEKIADFVNKNNIQFVASILKDKLPDELNHEKYFILKLSQKDKLFRIENQ